MFDNKMMGDHMIHKICICAVVAPILLSGYVMAGAKYEQKANSGGVYVGGVVAPGPVIDKPGKIVGYTDELGEMHVSGSEKTGASSDELCTLPQNVKAVFEGGKFKYGIDRNGSLVDACGNRIKHPDTISCKPAIVEGVKTEMCVDESQSLKSYGTLAAAVVAAVEDLNRYECKKIGQGEGHGLEASYGIYELNGKFYYGYKSWFTNTEVSAKSAPGAAKEIGNGYKLVATIHNHPDPKRGLTSQWFSLKDWRSARIRGVCSYLIVCAEGGGNGLTQRLLRLNPTTGEVDEMSFDTGEKISGPLNPTADTFPDFRFGIKGWCKCLDKQETSSAKSLIVGMDYTWPEDPNEVLYVYRFCLRCGKCRKDDFDALRRSGKKYNLCFPSERQRMIDDSKAEKETARQEALRIPDGEIVVFGKCKCKTPDPITSWYHPEEHVCVACGKYCDNPSGKIGSTAMRLMKEGR